MLYAVAGNCSMKCENAYKAMPLNSYYYHTHTESNLQELIFDPIGVMGQKPVYIIVVVNLHGFRE